MEIKKKLTREEAITTYVTDPDARVVAIAAAAGVSLQRFYQWLKAAGVKPNRKLGQHQRKSILVSQDEMRWKPDEIKALRAHMGLSQGDLARELGVRQQTISEWETGVYRPRRSTAKYLTMVAERVGFAYQTESEEEKDNEP